MLKCTHIVQSVGKLDNNDSYILSHGQEHLAQVLCLHLSTVVSLILTNSLGQLDTVKLRNTVNQMGNISSELLRHVLVSPLSILYNIMKQTCGYGFLVHLQVG